MKLYKFHKNELITEEVEKETKCFYFLKHRVSAFGSYTRIKKIDALLTPQQAIQEELNKRRTSHGVFSDKLAQIEIELNTLEELQKQYNK